MSEVDSAEAKPLTPLAPTTDGLDVRIAAELLQRARAEGVSLVGEGGLLSKVTRAVLKAALQVEMADHLGYDRGDSPPAGSVNERNGSSSKTVRTATGGVRLAVPRDRPAPSPRRSCLNTHAVSTG